MAGSLVPRTNLGGYLAEIGQVYADQRDREEAAKLLGGQLDNLVQQPMAQSMSALGALGQQVGGGGAPAPVSSPLPAFARAQGNAPSAKIAGLLADTTAKYNLSPDYLPKLVQIESGGNPNAYNKSGASGLAQFVPSTAKQYGLTDPFDPAASADAAARLTLDNRRVLASALGREPTNGELYLGHQQGAGGASKLLANPGARAVDIVGRQAVLQNGGSEDMTAAQFARKWTSKFDTGQTQTAQADMPAPGAREAGYYIPGQQAPAPQQAEFTPGTVASPAIGTGAAGSMPDAAGGQPRITPQQAQQLRAMLANPVTAPQAQAMIQKLQAPQEWETKELGGRVVQVNKQGAVRPLPGFEKAPEFQTQKGSDGNDYTFNKATGQWTRAIQGKSDQFADLVTPEERAAAGIPTTYSGPAQRGPNGELKLPGKAQTEVNIDNKAQSAFASKAGGGLADRFDAIAKEGDAGRTELALVGQLSSLASQIGTGAGAAASAKLAEYGIKIGPNVSQIEAYGSLIDKLTPSQRLPGAGATSDFDAKLFKSSLPRLINTPEGNALITGTLEALAKDKVERAAIADQALIGVDQGGITPAEAVKRLRALPAPNLAFRTGLSELQKSGRLPAQPSQTAQRQGPSAAQAAPAAPQVGVVQKGHRFLGGNPADPSSWERVGAPAQDGPIL